jgi:hypothetical protein
MATVLHRYYTLASVLEAQPHGMGYRVWAGDRVNENGGNTKFFVTCTPKDFHQLLHQGRFDVYNWYEVIEQTSPVRFHLDVEVERVDRDHIDETVVCMRKRLIHIGFNEADQVSYVE